MSNSSVFKSCSKVLRGSADLQLHDSEFQTEGALTLNAFADNVSGIRGTTSNSLSADGMQSACIGWYTLFVNDVRQISRCLGYTGVFIKFTQLPIMWRSFAAIGQGARRSGVEKNHHGQNISPCGTDRDVPGGLINAIKITALALIV